MFTRNSSWSYVSSVTESKPIERLRWALLLPFFYFFSWTPKSKHAASIEPLRELELDEELKLNILREYLVELV